MQASPRTSNRPRMPASVWALGFVSMFMDISSEMIHSLLPLFMLDALGLAPLLIGLIEGAAEATALIVKVFSGVLSDYLGKRKGLALFGYGLGAASKPLFAIAASGGMVLTARVIDRIGKGLRAAPRDALIADVTPPEIRGAAFGLRQALDTTGAFLGPLLAIALMLVFQNQFRAVFWLAVIPGALAVLALALSVREPPRGKTAARANPLRRENLKRLNAAYWRVVAVGAVFTLARFSEAFLLLRAEQTGIELAWTPLVMVAMNAVYMLGAYPFGKLSDRASRRSLLSIGLGVLIAADLLLAAADSWPWLIAGVMCWGLHMSITQGLLSKLVADTAPPDLIGSAFGFFNLVSGLAMLAASALAGAMWQYLGPAATFYCGAGFCGLSLILLAALPNDAKTKR